MGAAVALALCMALPSVASAALTPVATLSMNGAQGAAVVGPVAVSDGTLVATGPNGGFVFAEPSGGWANETQAATLATPPSGSGAVVSGRVIVSSENPPEGPSRLDVFVEPVGGWAGAVQPSAELSASDGANLDSVSISGSTVAAVGLDPATGLGTIYVFTEPLGGWSGTLREVAKLTGPAGVSISDVAVSGRSIVAAIKSNRALIFSEPAGGWAGNLRPVATLVGQNDRPLSPVAIDGRTVVAGLAVFTEPARSWGGNVHPAAQLGLIANQHSLGRVVAIAGPTIAISGYSLGLNHQCPCASSLWLFTKPAKGWSGTLAAAPALNPSTTWGPLPVALEDQNVFTSGGSSVGVYRTSGAFGHTAGKPAVQKVSLAGLATGRPRLGFRVQTGAGGLSVDKVTVSLPKGLSFAHNRHRLDAGISVSGRGPKVRYLVGRTLVIALGQSTNRVGVTIDNQAITEDLSLKRRAQRLIRSSHHSSRRTKLPLELRFVVSAASGPDTPMRATVSGLG
jgi:hypothetical protein